MSILAELRRRNVFKVGAAYAIVAWLLVQVADVVLPALQAPEWTISFITVLFILGFPITLIMAWAFDVTPEGIKATSDSTVGEAPTQPTVLRFGYISQGLILLAVGFLVVDQYVLQPQPGTSIRATSVASGSSEAVRRFPLDLPWQIMSNWGDFGVRISPQGTHLAYPGSDENRTTINLRPLDSLDSLTLVSPSADPWDLAFSPDGERLAFFTDGKRLQTVSIRGGRPEELFEFPAEQYTSGLSWGSDESILIGGEGGLIRVPTSGADSEFISATEATDRYHSPFSLPGGDHALVSIDRRGEMPRLGVIDLETAVTTELPFQGSEPIYSPTGHILFRQGTELLAAGFDLDSMQVLGQAREIATGVAYGPRLSEDGTLVYVAERVDGTAGLVWVDRQGIAVPLGAERRDYTHIDLSPDGTRVLLNSSDAEIFAYDINRGTLNLVTSASRGGAVFPLWHPNGELATFRQGGAVIYEKMADGSPQQNVLLELDASVPTSWSPDGENLAIFDGQSDIWILPREGEPQPFLDGPNKERSGRFSPDGGAFAYVSDELGGEFQVYITPFPGPGPRIAVSIEGGLSPLWSKEGDELYFRQGSKVMAASVTLAPEIDVSTPHELFDGPYTLDLSGHQRYDVAPDGRFLMVENSEDFRVVVVEGFFEELNRLVPTD